MPIEHNQYLYASVPVRIGLAAIAGLRWFVVRNRDPAVYNKKGALLGICLWDGLGALLLGWHLGSFDGRVPAYKLS